ncbi:cytochrome P450, partial [Streptomyces sp. SID7982]|nr:cytochrome P450 [Streptomyces sp. SID7982]
GTQRVVDRLLDEMAEEGAPADFVARVSSPLPLITICEALDIPEADRPWLRAHAMTMMNVGAAGKQDAVRAKAELRGYF